MDETTEMPTHQVEPTPDPYLAYLDETYIFPLGWTRNDGQLEYIGRKN